jgi:hypothetical protein
MERDGATDMKSLAHCVTIAISIVVTVPAQAQRARVFVASYGNDSNPYTFASPCRNFQQAVNVVASGGEVTAIDSAGFGTVTINKSVMINSPPGIEASIATGSCEAAITVNASSSDVVSVRGLTLNGGGIGSYGIHFTAGAKLAVFDCFVTNYNQYGIFVNVTSSTSVLVSNTIASESPAGIYVQTSGGGQVIATFNHDTFDHNTDGLELQSDSTGTIYAIISNSTFGANSNIGAYSIGSNSLTVVDSTFNFGGSMVYLAGDTTAFLSHIISPQGSLVCTSASSVHPNLVYLDGTNHFASTDMCAAPSNITSWTSR